MELTLDSPVRYVPRVGPAMAKRLDTLDIKTVEDLLYHVPFRYNDFSLTAPIASVRSGETVTISGTISAVTNIFTKTGKKMQRAVVTDQSGSISVIWFNQLFLARVFGAGDQVSLAGKVDWFGRDLALISPEYEIGNLPAGRQTSLHTGRLVPVYPETEGVSSKWLRARIAYLLEFIDLPDPIPSDVIKQYTLMELSDALHTVHFPQSIEEASAARRRLGFDELLLWQLRAKIERTKWQTTRHAHPLGIPDQDVTSVIQSLPFTLTRDQKQAVEDIFGDLGKSIPMNRLFVGDVGSGKTVVAALAMYIAFRNGASSLLMAPTEILAEQHYKTISALIGLPVRLVSGGVKEREVGRIGIYVGTHALLNAAKSIPHIGLIVIDEQHRFGVSQRSQLTNPDEGGITPHLLTMTATPIPRTMARVLFANIDLSILSTLPSGRQKVKTWVVPKEKREKAYQWIVEQITQTAAQVFIICPFIEESESLTSVRAVTTEFKKLQHVFANLRLGLLHGRMKAKEKNTVLTKFRQRQIDILVATPVVEVGIDIPGATIMMIEACERFGLSQLHQLRGRVGRGERASYCLLFTQDDNETTMTRLKSMETIHSGPELAEIDLRLRGPGDITGTRQHGLPSLHVAKLSDKSLIQESGEAAQHIVENDPELIALPLLRAKLEKGTITIIQD